MAFRAGWERRCYRPTCWQCLYEPSRPSGTGPRIPVAAAAEAPGRVYQSQRQQRRPAACTSDRGGGYERAPVAANVSGLWERRTPRTASVQTETETDRSRDKDGETLASMPPRWRGPLPFLLLLLLGVSTTGSGEPAELCRAHVRSVDGSTQSLLYCFFFFFSFMKFCYGLIYQQQCVKNYRVIEQSNVQ